MTPEILSDSILNPLRENGYVRVSNIFSKNDIAEVKRYTSTLIEQWKSNEILSVDFWSYNNKKKEKVLYRIHNFENHYSPIKVLIQKPEFQNLVSHVVGENSFASFYALIIKMPFAVGVPWHRDIDNIAPSKIYNFSIYLDDSFPENGCFEAADATHKDYNDYSQIKAPENASKISALETDIIIHDVRLFHSSGLSNCESLRRSIIIEFRT